MKVPVTDERRPAVRAGGRRAALATLFEALRFNDLFPGYLCQGTYFEGPVSKPPARFFPFSLFPLPFVLCPLSIERMAEDDGLVSVRARGDDVDWGLGDFLQPPEVAAGILRQFLVAPHPHR